MIGKGLKMIKNACNDWQTIKELKQKNGFYERQIEELKTQLRSFEV